MDTSKGIAWLGNIYQKLENMYLEVDEIMQQEISKQAERLGTVGANIKKIVSESEEALLQSILDIKEQVVPDSFLAQNTDNTHVGADEDCGKRSLADGVHLGSGGFGKSISSGLALEETDDIEMKNFQLEASDKKDSSFEAEVRSSNHADVSSNISDDALAISNSTTDVHDSFVESKSTMPLPVYDSFDESESTMMIPESEKWENDVTNSGLQTSQTSNEVKLDESCIFVDGIEIQSIFPEDAKCSSYKKKLKDAFALKMGLLRNHNQQKERSFATPTVTEKASSSDYEFSESEWEII